MTSGAEAVIVRPCRGFAELDACVALQAQTWRYDPADVIPRRLFVVAQYIGGQVIGAFAPGGEGADPLVSSEQMVGFAMSIPGVRQGRTYLHSHMLAVLPECRNAGLGRRLKCAQREEALSRGIDYMEWTFDPLEIKNGFFNVVKLGAIARLYYRDFYGVSSARLQGGRPTDRLLAEWHLRSPRVLAAIAGNPLPPTTIEETVTLPAAVMTWKESPEGSAEATALQIHNRKRFEDAFQRGLAVVGFRRDTEGNGSFELGRCKF